MRDPKSAVVPMKDEIARTPADAPAEPLDWKGTERFEVVRCIGRGGMGAVYEGRDRERGQNVALKTLLHFGPEALYLFKHEFRTLAGVHHPNLVRLYELVAGDVDRVFFSMELVHGTDFLTHVLKPGTTRVEDGPTGLTTREMLAAQAESGVHQAAADASRDAGRTRRTSPADFDRLRPALRQLVEGVHALHANRKLHRDIKPSNVLVTSEGRVVLLDFGVATELPRAGDENLSEMGQVVGTARYMAPEQGFEDGPTPAADWYSVGVVLHEALVGAPPFSGPLVDVIRLKSTVDAPPPSESVDGVPRDLDELCRALLERDPQKRLLGSDVLRCLGNPRNSLAPSLPPDRAPGSGLVGREPHLRALRAAFRLARGGRNVTVRLSGPAGSGKSVLMQHFLDDLVRRGDAVVLRGRAYERESVAYKAVDGVVDALSRHLMHVHESENGIAFPKDIWALARLFPVLRRVPGIEGVAEEPVTDPLRVRRRAFAALRELLGSLSGRRPLVIYLDDVRWGDTDSAALLLELVRPPNAPPVMFVLAYRAEDAHTAPFLTELYSRWPSGASTHDIDVGPLEADDARRLALALLASNDDAARKMAEAIGRESDGSPFLVEELARSAAGKHHDASDAKVTLDQMVAERLARLPEEARRLVEVIAVGGRPLPVSTVCGAAQLAASDELVDLLQRRHFVRRGMSGGREVVEAIHDRIRETIVAQLSPDSTRQHHGRLAQVMEATPDANAEALARHLFGAGDIDRAVKLAEQAAEQAVLKLAFDQAAHLLRLAIEGFPASSPDGSRLRKRLGEVLEWAGRSAEAGRVYLEAAEGAPWLEKLDLQRAAAEQLHASGLMDEGTHVLRRVLAAVNVWAPRSPLTSLLWFLSQYLWLRLRGLNFRPRELQPEERLRLDTLNAVALGFALVDNILGVSMKARVLVEALHAGDKRHTSRGAALMALDLAGYTGPERAMERKLREVGQKLAGDDPVLKFTARVTYGLTRHYRGHFKEAKEILDPLQAMSTNRRVGQQSGLLFTLHSIQFLGDMTDLTARYTRALTDAEERGNLFMSVALRTSTAASVWLAADDPERARHELRDAMSQWGQKRFSSPEWRATVSEAEVDLYVGDGEGAHERIRRLLRAMTQNCFFVYQSRALVAFTQGRAAIASLPRLSPWARGARLREIPRLRRIVGSKRMPWTAPLSSILEAGVARATGHLAGAEAALRAAITGAEAADMALHAASARHELGLLIGGHEGAVLVSQAREAMTTLGVLSPARFAPMLVPGREGGAG
ncbi:MAG: serine/threonine-protein kinase PknK [Polyangiaceae bacterium]